MGARVSGAMRLTVLVALLVGALLGPSGQMGEEQVAGSPAIEAVTGAGWGSRAMCLGCAVGLFGAGGATIGGIVIEAMLYPEAFAACGIICVKAF